jgi:hypothetical protein
MAKSPDKIVADIDAAQNKEDLELPKRIGEAAVKGAKAVKDKVNEDLTGGAYVGSRLNMGKLYDKSVGVRAEEALNEGKPTLKDKIKTDINNSVQLYKQGLGMKSDPLKDVNYKKGGSISKIDMQKAGFYDKNKTKSERQAIVSKVTTKPQRVAIVEKAFLTKNMKSGGSVSTASKRADGCCIRGKTRA